MNGPESPPVLHVARFAELDAATLYALLRLRVDVFVVEQTCPYPELDGRDVEEGTRHVWLASAQEQAQPLAYLRVLAEPDGSARIGRVCAAAKVRGTGMGRQVMAAALDLIGPATAVVLDAQAHLTDLYAGFGFRPDGDPFVEDGIPHVPMRRPVR